MSGPLSRIGSYVVERELGRGGMGVVYLAHDPKLDRPVAIKAMGEDVALDPERRARFEREARILASLNHPNVAGIYGIEEVEGHLYLVLEYVEGQTLAERIKQGAMAAEDALEVASQIAQGIAAAHEAGVIHRDLKPGNVKLTPQNQVKVLDFGLAKSGVLEPTSGSDPSRSPTVAFAATRDGLVLGTAGYMSPEQARGRPVDRRTDIWALGCVLYEMLAGHQAFQGETISDTLAAVLRGEPEWADLPEHTPAAVRRVLKRCLEKDPRKRLRDACDLRLELEDALVEPSNSGVSRPLASTRRAGVGTPAMWAAVGLSGVIVGAGLLSLLRPMSRVGDGGPDPVTRVSINLPKGFESYQGGLSQDGRTLFFASQGTGGGTARLFARPLDSFEARPLDGTAGVRGGFASCIDGRWIYFVKASDTGSRTLFRIPSDGSAPPVSLLDWKEVWGTGTGLANGDIVALDRESTKIFHIPSGSTEAEEIPLKLNGFTGRLERPVPLPDNKAFLANAIYYGERGFQVGVALIEIADGSFRMLINDGGNAVYSPTGHLLFARGETLLAVPFDLANHQVKGDPVAVTRGLRTENSWAPALFSLSNNGTLLYVPGGLAGSQRHVAVLQPDGKVREWMSEGRSFQGAVTVSSDGRRLAAVITNGDGIDEVFLGDVAHPGLRRFAAIPSVDLDFPKFTPDGEALILTRTSRSEDDGLYLYPLSGAPPRRILKTGSPGGWTMAVGWTPDGDLLVAQDGKGSTVIGRLSLDKGEDLSNVRPLFQGKADFGFPDFSPDGRMVAYPSNESGKFEVYVAPYADGAVSGRAVPVSRGLGYRPLWSKDGRHLTWISGDDKVMKMAVDPKTGYPKGDATPLVSYADLQVAQSAIGFEAGPGGDIYFIERGEEEGAVKEYDLVLNWFTELRERLAAARPSRR